MTRAYGSCIEPDGMDLANELDTCPCPCCAQTAQRWFIEHAEGGSLNTYSGLSCQSCGLETGSFPGDP